MKWTVRITLACVLLILLNALSWSGQAEEARWGRRPSQIYRQLPADIKLGGADVLVVAHNAGDNAAATSLAIAHGADIVEIDVRPIDGRLYAAHDEPNGWVPVSYRGPTLKQAWTRTAGARYVLLDFKDTSSSSLRLLDSFLTDRTDNRRVFVSMRSITALERIKEMDDSVVRLLSIGDRQGLTKLLENPDQVEVLNGVSIRADLLDPETMAWLKDRGLLVSAWIVNDLTTINHLIGLGVDSVTTDNLALLDAMRLAEQRRDLAKVGRLLS